MNPKRPAREVVLTCRVEGKVVSIEDLARELVRCGGITREGASAARGSA